MSNIPLSASDDNNLSPYSPEFPRPSSPDQMARVDYIRCQVDDGDLLFVGIDVIMWAKDADYKAAQNLFNYYKSTALSDGSQPLRIAKRLKALAMDGKMRLTDFLSSEQLLRLIQEIPGKKTSRIKDWLAWVGAVYLQERDVTNASDADDAMAAFIRRPSSDHITRSLMDSYAAGAARLMYYRQFASSDTEAFNMAMTRMCADYRLTPVETKAFFQERVPKMLAVLRKQGLISAGN